jgi:hypothetical protein
LTDPLCAKGTGLNNCILCMEGHSFDYSKNPPVCSSLASYITENCQFNDA